MLIRQLYIPVIWLCTVRPFLRDCMNVYLSIWGLKMKVYHVPGIWDFMRYYKYAPRWW